MKRAHESAEAAQSGYVMSPLSVHMLHFESTEQIWVQIVIGNLSF
jgi:hypothetical protein